MKPKIFLSRPAVVSGIQESIFVVWSSYLLELGFQVKRLQRHQYSDEPWKQLRKIVEQADGVVAFGFSQVIVEVRERQDEPPRSMRTSPWIHIETAMAIETATPVLAVPEPGIEEGVFEPSIWSGCLYGIPAGAAPSRTAVPERWIDAVHLASRKRSIKLN